MGEIALGSQFAVAELAHRRFPNRIGLITGHRIPLGLFPVETQNRILEVEESATQDPKYVIASSFRRSRPSSSSTSTTHSPTTSTTSTTSTSSTSSTTNTTNKPQPEITT